MPLKLLGRTSSESVDPESPPWFGAARRLFYTINYWLGVALGSRRKGNKAWFEYIYSKRYNPWNNDTDIYHLAQYQCTLNSLPRSHYDNVLEIGCSVGVFTSMIAERANTVHGIDISSQAIERARKRCKHLSHVSFEATDLLKFESHRQYDLICAAEVLYFMAQNRAQIVDVVKQVASSLSYGGQVVTVCGSEVNKQNNWEEHFPRHCDELRLVYTKIVRDPRRDYRISLFEKRQLLER
jgi:protein-L-isoaspartate O-methyltransferase